MDDSFSYSKAVVCGVPSTLPAVALRQDASSEPVNLEIAQQQHQRYVEVLKGLLKEVHVIEPDDRFPDCVFVEDPVVVCGDTALLTILGHESRRGETVAMRKKMEELGLQVVDMKEPGRMDGGDVLFTGREFFVGLSTRTNKAGIDQLAAAFPHPVTRVPLHEGLHLKSFLSMAGQDLIAIGTSAAASDARNVMEEKGHFKYNYLEVPDDIGANCLYLNDTLVHASKEAHPNTNAVFEQLDTRANKIAISATELNKVDGCFTCCSVLIK